MQDKVRALVALDYSSQQVAALCQQHPRIKFKKEEALQEKLRFVAHILEVPVISSEVLEFVMPFNVNSNVFASNVNTQREGLAFLKKIGVSEKKMANVLQHNVCRTNPGEMKLRCQHLTARLGLSFRIQCKSKAWLSGSPVCSLPIGTLQKEKWHVLTNVVRVRVPLERLVGNPRILLSAMEKICLAGSFFAFWQVQAS